VVGAFSKAVFHWNRVPEIFHWVSVSLTAKVLQGKGPKVPPLADRAKRRTGDQPISVTAAVASACWVTLCLSKDSNHLLENLLQNIFWADGRVLYFDCGSMAVLFVKTHRTTH